MFLPNSLFIKTEGLSFAEGLAANASAENGEVRRRIHAARTAVDDIERSVSAGFEKTFRNGELRRRKADARGSKLGLLRMRQI